MITPSSNTWVEPITTAMLSGLGPEVTAHFTRVKVTRIGLAAEELAQFDGKPMLSAADLLADSEVDVIAWNGTSGSWIGLEADRQLSREIEVQTGIPATTATLAIIEALHSYGVKRFGLAVPYVPEVAERIVDTYRQDGLDCVGAKQLGISTNADFGRVTESEIEALVRAAAPDSEAVAIVCTNLAAAPLVARLESALGIPVIDSIAATIWKSLDLVAPDRYLTGWGDLLLTGSLRVKIQPLLERLLEDTDASRTTLRVDIPERRLHVDRVAGEAVRPGITPIRLDGSLDQWAMPTVKRISESRRVLVQNDFSIDGPEVSPELVRIYGVKAQMLGPINRGGRVAGWISVHQVGRTRVWSDDDQQLLRSACLAAEMILDNHSPATANPVTADA
jgi:maleate isomerase